MYRNICTEYDLDPPRFRWETHQKVVENNRAKRLWDIQIQTERRGLAKQPDIVVVDKKKKQVVIIDIAVPSDSNINKKEYKKLEKDQGPKEVIQAPGPVIPKLEDWLQQIPGTITELSVQRSAVLGTANVLRRTLKLPGFW